MLNCQLCNSNMVETGEYLTCQKDTNHAINVTKEYDRYKSGEKDINWLRNRMKVRLGKNVHGR